MVPCYSTSDIVYFEKDIIGWGLEGTVYKMFNENNQLTIITTQSNMF